MTSPAPGVTDLHSHLVPGVDDGARNLDEALAALKELAESGVTSLLTTPHLDASLTHHAGRLEARLGEIEEGWKSFEEAAERVHPGLVFGRGQELMLDVPDPSLKDPRLRMAGTSFVLVEWPGLQVPPGTTRVLDRLARQGVRIVIAHPERYRGMDAEVSQAGQWRAAGAFLQINNGSLLGRYGRDAARRALTLLERGWADLLSSDFHARPHLRPYVEEVRDALSELGGTEQFELLATVNPARVLRDEAPLPVPPLVARPVRKGRWRRLRAVLGWGGGE